jgi:pimeloyl-ACP methyl ester carboxylesterase
MVQPTTRYARSGSVSIAYQVVGDGGVDLVLVPGFVSHVEVAWEEPRLARFLTRLASFSRLIVFDKRGTGMSDPVPNPPSIDERMDDIGAVMDAAGSTRAAIVGISEGGTLSLLFGDAHPDLDHSCFGTSCTVHRNLPVSAHLNIDRPAAGLERPYRNTSKPVKW